MKITVTIELKQHLLDFIPKTIILIGDGLMARLLITQIGHLVIQHYLEFEIVEFLIYDVMTRTVMIINQKHLLTMYVVMLLKNLFVK